MNKKDLIANAKKNLVQPPKDFANEFSSKVEEIAAEVNSRLSARSDLEQLIGKENIEMMKDNTHNFTRFMESLFFEFDAETFVETVIWAIKAYKAHGFKLTFWPAELNTFMEVIKDKLSNDCFANVSPFYKWITVNIPVCLNIIEQQE